MLSSISWNQYGWVCGTVAVIYYLAIGWIYYRLDFLRLIHISKASPPKGIIDGHSGQEEDLTMVQQYSFAEQIKRDIKEIFVSIPAGAISKEQVVHIIQERISGFSLLKDGGLKAAINNLIIQQAKSNRHTDLSDQDLLPLWKDTSYNDVG